MSSGHAESSSAPSATACVENVNSIAFTCTTASAAAMARYATISTQPCHIHLPAITTHATRRTTIRKTKITNLKTENLLRISPILDSAVMLQQENLEPR